MRVVVRFFARLYWDEAVSTMFGSIIILLISLFFANFDRILPLYDPVVTSIPNSHPGVMGIFQAIEWPAWASSIASITTSCIQGVIRLRRVFRRKKA